MYAKTTQHTQLVRSLCDLSFVVVIVLSAAVVVAASLAVVVVAVNLIMFHFSQK